MCSWDLSVGLVQVIELTRIIRHFEVPFHLLVRYPG